jgi:DnaB helicase-like protein
MSCREDRRIRAEQALLGAVLSDPAGQAYLLDLVEPRDMGRPYHGQVLVAMQRLRGRGVVPGPLAVYEEIKKDPDLPRIVSHDGVLIASLMEAAPRSNHGSAYAAMVVGSGIRQRIALVGSRMAQAADGQDLDTAFAMVAQAREELDRCRARWEALPEPMRRELPVPARDPSGNAELRRSVTAARDEIRRLRWEMLAGTGHGLEDRLASIAQRIADVAMASTDLRARQEQARAASEARPSGADADEAGARALRDLADDPSKISTVRGWLRPAHFARAEHGELYAVMRDMADAGHPVDPVTVSWEAARRGIDADAEGLAGGMGPLAVASAREVHRRGLLAEVARAGQDIQAGAEDARSAPGKFLRSASDRLRRLDRDLHPRECRPGDWRLYGWQPAAGPAAEAEAGAA